MKLLLFLISTAIMAEQVSAQVPAEDDFQTKPRRALAAPGGTITLLGKLDVPLQRCHFYLPGPSGRFLDFSQGENSKSTDQYEYYGKGLENGECGIRMKRIDEEDDGIVECKVRPQGSSQWKSCVSTLRVTDVPVSELPVFNIVPRKATLTRGDNITITCNADRPLNMCHIYLPGPRYLNFDRGVASKSTSEYRYHGTGLEDGQCGVDLQGVDERLNGYVVCKLGQWPEQITGAWETDALKVTTARLASGSANVQGAGVRPPQPFPTTSVAPTRTPSDINTRLPSSTETTCPPLISQSLIINCSFAGEVTDCAEPQEVGAKATLSCKPGHEKPPTVFYTKVICKRGGVWDQPLFTCTSDCGKRKTNKGNVLIHGGVDGEIGEFPWHIGIYQLEGSTFEQMCAGSLITPNLVVSVVANFVLAAHCFWNPQTNSKNNASLYKMAAGKHLRVWEDANPSVQTRDILDITMPALYRGRFTNFASDIALLRPKIPFEVTAAVNLVCFDWDNVLERRQLRNGSNGIVTGWGYTEGGTQSDVLRYVQLPYITPGKCLDALPNELQTLLTHDKLCAGFVNHNTSVCRGDSGGGLVFAHPDSGRYFLRGIVSIAFTPATNNDICYAQQYTGFTKFSTFQDWFQDNV